MSENKTPKLTTRLELTLLERLSIHAVVRSMKPADRDDERRWGRVWDALDLDGAVASGKPAENGQTTFQTSDLRKSKKFDIDAAHADCLDKLPVALSMEQARVLAPIREKVDKARESLK